MELNLTHEFILGEIAPNYVFGCTWCLLSLNEYEKKQATLKEVIKDLGKGAVTVTRVKNGVIVFVTHDAYSKVMGELEGVSKVVNVKEDIELYKKNLFEAKEEYAKFLKKSKAQNKHHVIGLYCTNKTPMVKEKYKENSFIEYPAFRLTIQQAQEVAKKLGMTVAINTNEAQISNGLTALMVPIVLLS